MKECDEIEVYLSGLLDNELTQQQRQQVSLHLSTCEKCRRVLSELEEARAAARELQMEQLTRREWKEMEMHIFEQTTRSLGWAILIVWSVVTACYGIYQFAVSPEGLWAKTMVFGLFLGFALIFLSILSQRLRESRTDRYRGVMK